MYVRIVLYNFATCRDLYNRATTRPRHRTISSPQASYARCNSIAISTTPEMNNDIRRVKNFSLSIILYSMHFYFVVLHLRKLPDPGLLQLSPGFSPRSRFHIILIRVPFQVKFFSLEVLHMFFQVYTKVFYNPYAVENRNFQNFHLT